MQEGSAEADVAEGGARGVGAARHAIGGVALDRLHLAVRQHGLHHADVLVPDDQVAGSGLRAGRRSALPLRWAQA